MGRRYLGFEWTAIRDGVPRLPAATGSARRAKPPPNPASPCEPPPAAPEPAAPLATILVVEDEAGIRALVRKILRRQGYEVLEAANGQDALALCREHGQRIELLITDVLMPQMGGRELVERLQTQGSRHESALRLRLHRRHHRLLGRSSAGYRVPAEAVYSGIAARQGERSSGEVADAIHSVYIAL